LPFWQTGVFILSPFVRVRATLSGEVGLLGLLLIFGLTTARAEVPGLDAPAAQMSARQKTEATESAILEMRQSVATVQRYLESAKASKQPDDELRCLQTCLTPMQALLDISLQSQNAMKQALAEGNDGHSDLEYRKILVALSKVREFLAKAMLCAGNPPGTANSITQSNVVTSPDDIPDVDNAVDPESRVPLSATPF
jgi:hypothetical protein